MLLKLGRTLGFFKDPEKRLTEEIPDLSKALVEMMLNYRNDARERKDWALADKIRNDLLELGIEIKDSPEGSTWNMRK